MSEPTDQLKMAALLRRLGHYLSRQWPDVGYILTAVGEEPPITFSNLQEDTLHSVVNYMLDQEIQEIIQVEPEGAIH